MADILPACVNCRMFIKHTQYKMVCEKYPKVIPHEIIMGKKCKHFEAVKGKKKS